MYLLLITLNHKVWPLKASYTMCKLFQRIQTKSETVNISLYLLKCCQLSTLYTHIIDWHIHLFELETLNVKQNYNTNERVKSPHGWNLQSVYHRATFLILLLKICHCLWPIKLAKCVAVFSTKTLLQISLLHSWNRVLYLQFYILTVFYK